jgi:hypothetical protein
MSTKQVTWWSPGGFVLEGEPAAHLTTHGQTGDWEEILKSAGYEKISSVGNESTTLEVFIYDNQEGKHLMVEIWNWDRSLSRFFVHVSFENEFFAIWYLDFVHKVAHIKLAEQLSDLTELVRNKMR